MKLVYQGKTKDVYEKEDENYILVFKDDVTGEDGVFDPGANQVGLSIPGIGNKGLRLTTYFFEHLNNNGYATHFINSDFEQNTMEVKQGSVFGRGLEVICRLRATGSFIRRYGAYAKEGCCLNYLVEFTIKDDERNDPLINQDALAQLNILSEEEYNEIVKQTKAITKEVEELLCEKDLTLYDIKLEFGRDQDNKIMLIDEISGGNMRVYYNKDILTPEQLTEYFI